jgi:glucose-6-phosphate 1-dehydrogenase
MERTENCIIVIFGASGELTKKKLMPSLFDLYRKNLLPRNFGILGIGRTDFTDESFREKVSLSLKIFVRPKPVNQKNLREFLKHVYYQEMDSNNAEEYAELKERLSAINDHLRANGNYIYYLATPPGLYEVITQNLGEQEMQKQGDNEVWKRIVFEKPFGFDLESAKVLNAHIQHIFAEDQIYRIDHYLDKETVQNILTFRFANGIFEPLWNRNCIHHVEVMAAENIGVEDRGEYYNDAGALRDMVQNHLLQVLATVAMEPPSKFEANAIRNEKVKLFQSLCPINPDKVAEQVVRGQYLESTIRGEKIPAYRKEKNVAKDSRTETFVALKLHIDNWRWGGVPFYIRTGKRLPTRVTEVAIHFKKTPHSLFTREFKKGVSDNQLIIRIQPDEGILLRFVMKSPGAGFNIRNVNMDFHYKELGESEIPDAYERLLLDCILGDASLYARADGVEACWAFITPILQAWQENPDIKLYGYPAGTWGPKEASDLFEDQYEDWRYPSKSLVNGGDYREL